MLGAVPHRVVACSGGVDSLLLADLAHSAPGRTVVVHSVTPAVPEAATQRVARTADELGWDLRLVTSAEFDDARYLANPVDRCYFCKSNLYTELGRIGGVADGVLLSGANTDDLADYRPGLVAAAEHQVRHPYVEAGVDKSAIRALAHERGRSWHDLAAAPCLASRLYTGTVVTPSLVRAVDRGETHLRAALGVDVVRCRIRADEVLVETAQPLAGLTDDLLVTTLAAMRAAHPALTGIRADPLPYRPGRAFLTLGQTQAGDRPGR